jgi:hypothetical protein
VNGVDGFAGAHSVAVRAEGNIGDVAAAAEKSCKIDYMLDTCPVGSYSVVESEKFTPMTYSTHNWMESGHMDPRKGHPSTYRRSYSDHMDLWDGM